MLIGDFTEKAVIDSGIEDAVASTSGFYLTAAALFYLVAIAVVLSTLVLIRTGTSSQKLTEVASAESDVETYTLVEGTTTTIQQLIGRGVGVNTTLVVGDTVDDEGGSTVIAVSASLYNDEVTEFPEEATEDVVEVDDKGPDKQLVMLVDYLKKTNQSVFEFFKSIDLDDSGNIDGFEFQQALKTSDVGDYPPWELDGLLSAIDLDNDGKINLPELDIALAQIAAKYAPSEQDESPEEAPHEEADSEDSDAVSHTEASLAKLKKAELIEIAKNLGVSTSGTKSDLTSAILNA